MNVLFNSSFAVPFKAAKSFLASLQTFLSLLSIRSNQRTWSHSEIHHKRLSSLLLLDVFKVDRHCFSRANPLTYCLHDFFLGLVLLRSAVNPENIWFGRQSLLDFKDQIGEVLYMNSRDYVVPLPNVKQCPRLLDICLAKMKIQWSFSIAVEHSGSYDEYFYVFLVHCEAEKQAFDLLQWLVLRTWLSIAEVFFFEWNL